MIFLRTAAAAERRQRIIEQAGALASRRGAPVLACVSEAAPLRDAVDVYRRAASATETVSYWEQPSCELAMVAAGAAWSLRVQGASRFTDAASAWKSIAGHAVGDVDGLACFGGFAFDTAGGHDAHWRGFGDGEIVVPEVLYRREGPRARITRCVLVRPDGRTGPQDARLDAIADGADTASQDARSGSLASRRESPDAEAWMRSVEALTAAIWSGGIDKVVLAREVVLEAHETIDAASALAALRDGYRDCTVFAAKRAGACFAGATPERLVRVQDRRLSAACVAGSSRRGSDARDDAAAGDALLADPKERSEHDMVRQMIVDALTPLCGDLRAPAEPGLMRMPNVQHLYTPIDGTLRGDAGVLDLVARLHPTPAVGGVPREEALALIREHEPFGRGWYAGPIGWMDARGDGEFAVALRSGLLRGNAAHLYAGCGIVRDSEPAREHEESKLKLRPMLCALNLH
jgi:isochorismate synthase